MANLDSHSPGSKSRLSPSALESARGDLNLRPALADLAQPSSSSPGSEPMLSFRSLPPMRYPGLYMLFVFVSSLDIMLTWMVLDQHGGYEVNPLAASVIEHWGLPGAIAFKFSLMLFVIIICEVIGRQRDRTARRLARWSVGVSAFPPIYTMALVTLHLMDGPLSMLRG